MNKPILYSGTKNASSWAMRAWLALKSAGYDFEEKVVDIRRPQRFPNLARIGAFSPPACVPVLNTGETIIFDSNAIMEFANDFSGGKLLPTDIEMRAQARSLVAWQHTGLSSICSSIGFEMSFYPVKRTLSREEQAECQRLFSCYESCLKRSNGPYLFGIVTLADFMHAPTVLRLYRHNADTADYPLTAKWMETILDDPLVSEWVKEADTLPHIWYDEYLLPGSEEELAKKQ